MTGHEASTTVTTATDTPPHQAYGPPSPLSMTGVSRDGAALLLSDQTGAPFLLDITPALRAALRGDASRIGKVETTMDSTLRPRDIQARIRSGESAAAVAEAAQTSVDKIMAFAGPVLAERQHVADRAQRSNLRRPVGESAGTTRTLGDAVAAHLRSCNVDPEAVTWDAWRREDGRWSLVADYELSLRTGSAHFTFDTPGNYVMLDNEDARWLVGESVASPAPARDDLQGARERRLTSVPADELALGDDAIGLVHEDAAAPEPELEEPVLPLDAFFADEPSPEPATETVPEAEAEPVVEPVMEAPAEPVVVHEEAADEPVEEPPARRAVAKKKGRASVPSWDEIMFGPNDG
ncbi:septation protein SepH [Nocardioides sp.]|uniref:septation protein SepH n=1 Tax=Nocardioides sp. TaxID=35761 RepID=UPI002B26A3F3|nr:septation protein SepH [Nocardioides sp.]